MSIALTQPENYQASTDLRVTGLSMSLETRYCVIVLTYGYKAGGTFQKVREIRVEFKDGNEPTSPSFTDLVTAVPEFRQLGKALEDYLAATFPQFGGAVT